MVAAAPNIWSLSEAGKTQKLGGVDALRGYYGGNDYTALANESRVPGLGAQLGALGQYQAQAQGLGGPSLAEMQLRQQSDQQMGQALALASRGRGGNIAGNAQQAMAANAYTQQQTNADAAQLRAAEQAQAQAAAAQLGGQLYQQGFGYDQLGNARTLGADSNALGWYSAERGMDLERDAQNRQWTLGLVQAGAGAVGGLMGAASQMSDERVKTNIQPGGLAASQAVGELEPKTFEYKPGFGEPGQRVGVMAQDLLRTPQGAAIIRDTPLGYAVDTGGLASLGVAASSENKHEIDALKDQVGQLTALLGAQSGSTTSQQYVRSGLGGY
ncbi:MAG TPA: tail fiber domain-containing protein [Candidatus Limnocylindria bacterium]|nr:tail fiber domain-containing protein [Candidatus Limnocylindria bacterium]